MEGGGGGSRGIRDGNGKARFEVSEVEKLKKRLEMYELVFESIHNGVVVVDPEGYIRYFNGPYGQFIGVDPARQIGRHVTEVIENTRMHIVVRTGKPEINVAQRIKGQDMVVQRIPIRKDGKVIAALGQVMFKSISDVNKLARKLSLLESKVKLYEEELLSLRSTRYTFESIVGVSDAVLAMREIARKAAGTNLPVLITGESGVGKELFAQAIHNGSNRRLHPFIRINCAAIPKDLIESELFGYEKGAFTGAKTTGKPGKFELANHGSIFLDEIGDLPLETQPKLLRVLEEKEFERVGGTSYVTSNFRLIAASNQNLEAMVEGGKFRKDLYYRLNVVRIFVPPLRERRADIIPLARHILRQLCEDLSLPEPRIEPKAEEALINYPWPGNVRELYNVIERILSFLEGEAVIRYQDLPLYVQSPKIFSPEPQKQEGDQQAVSLREKVSLTEKETLVSVLERAGNNKAKAAKMLGIHRTHLYKKLKKFGLA